MMAGWLKNESESYLSTFYVSDDLYSVLEKAGEAKICFVLFRNKAEKENQENEIM